MNVRKYLFWMNDVGIKTYKVTKKGTFELLKPAGRESYTDKDLEKFCSWFHKEAAITDDEFIDFCFLSVSPIESPLFDYNVSTKSSWDKQEISIFCDKYIGVENYKIYYEEDKCFVCQNGNVLDKKSIKTLYLKCIPEFSIETEERIDPGSEETSLVNRFFIEKLKELDEG